MISLFGTLLAVLVGPVVPIMAPPQLLEGIERVEVTHSDEGRSGFQMTLRVGRGRLDFLDNPLLATPLLRPFSRIILAVTFNVIPQILFDGFITNQQLMPSEDPGGSRLTVTGDDVSVMMDLEEKSVEHPAQDETVIVHKILVSYFQYLLTVPKVIPPPVIDPPIPIERTPVQQGTDLEYLQGMAERHGYVFYVSPGPIPGTNQAYWGPPPRLGEPQKAISASIGSGTNVKQIDFQYDGLAPSKVSGIVQDRDTNFPIPVRTVVSTRLPLVTQPAWLFQSHMRTQRARYSGLNVVQAYARGQAETDKSQDSVITATGELDALKYEALLQPRGLVGVRGIGYSYDGFYYVKEVTHTIEIGSYSQRFTLMREGLGSITPVVRP